MANTHSHTLLLNFGIISQLMFVNLLVLLLIRKNSEPISFLNSRLIICFLQVLICPFLCLCALIMFWKSAIKMPFIIIFLFYTSKKDLIAFLPFLQSTKFHLVKKHCRFVLNIVQVPSLPKITADTQANSYHK